MVVVGFVVLAAGMAMLVLPGPGMLVSAIGLGLALECRWVERLPVRVAEKSAGVLDRIRRRG